MRKTLEFQRRAFERWRCLHEAVDEWFFPPMLNEALMVIMEPFDTTLAKPS